MNATNGATLNVHHIKYRKGAMPWEYSDDELVTLCEGCHSEIHRDNLDLVKQDDNIRYELSDFSLQIGNLITYEHSDYDNYGIVYHVDQKEGVVKSVTIDNGSGCDGMWFDKIDLYDMTSDNNPVCKLDCVHYGDGQYNAYTGEDYDEFECFGLVADFFYHVWNEDNLGHYGLYGKYYGFEPSKELRHIYQNFDSILLNNKDIERYIKDNFHL